MGKMFGVEYGRCNERNECCGNMVYMEKEGDWVLFGWWKRNVDGMNGIEEDEDVERRVRWRIWRKCVRGEVSDDRGDVDNVRMRVVDDRWEKWVRKDKRRIEVYVDKVVEVV